jgi:nitronate monooxygenase
MTWVYTAQPRDAIALLEEQVPIVSFTFGIPVASLLARIKAGGIAVIGTATTVREGLQWAAAGCDLLVAQGSEAGGHRGTFAGPFEAALIGTMALVPQMADQVRVPILAAGGIMDGRGLAAALALGAVGAQLGTAFLTCAECGITAAYKDAILASDEESTTLTSAFTGKLARGIRNRFMEEMGSQGGTVPGYPIQHFLTQSLRREAARQDRTDLMALWAGQGTRLSRPTEAGRLVRVIAAQALAVLADRS